MARFWDWLNRILGRAKPPEGMRPAPRPVPAGGAIPEDSSLLQFARRTGGRAGTTDIVVGVDFGTSCARVALQSPYKLDGRVVLVDFGQIGHPSCRFLLPSRIYVDTSGRLSLTAPEHVAEVQRHLKVALLDSGEGPPLTDRTVAWATAYVAAALREARRFFLDTQADSYGADEIRWSFNLGIPSAGYDDREIRERFHRLARAAWKLSLRPETPTLDDALETLASSSLPPGGEVDTDVVPEVAAQVVGYAKSWQRQEGLHLLLDVGASTLDLCSFCLHEHEGDDSYELLTADVQPLGLLELHRRRITAANGEPPFDAVPDDLVSPLPDWLPADPRRLAPLRMRECDDGFTEECARRVLLRTLFDLRRRRDPHSPRWDAGLPIFMCGGGASARVISDVVQLADRVGRKNWNRYAGLRLCSLPMPSSVSGRDVPRKDFGRFSVAFGLSFLRPNIGRIEPPSAIEDIRTTDKFSDWKGRFIDKDQV